MKTSNNLRISNINKLAICITMVIFLFSACGQINGDEAENGNHNSPDVPSTNINESQTGNVVYLTKDEFNNEMRRSENKERDDNKGYKYYSLMSQSFGIPIGIMIIPESWYESKNTADGLLFEGPDNIKIFKAQFASHFYSNDQMLNQSYMQMGRSVAPPKSIERFIDEDLAGLMQSEGFRFTGSKPLPELAAFDKRFDSYLFKAIPEQKHYQCILTEWEDQKGNPAMVIVRFFENYYQIGGMDWGYTVNAMSADKNVYEKVKNAYIYSLVNFWINPKWVEANNQYYAEASRQQTAGHNKRMAALKAQGQAIIEQGRVHSEMLDRNHEQFMNNLRSDGGHSQFIDYIRDETNITNTATGNTYKVESGSNYYWMNNDGQYIRTDDANWNPNTDPGFNNQDWSSATIHD